MEMRSALLLLTIAASFSFWGYLTPKIILADTASSTNFIIERGVIDSGGGRATSSNFFGESSIGQSAVGISSSSNFVLKGGFLYFRESSLSSSTSTPTPSTTPSSTSSGGGGGYYDFILPGQRPVLTPEIITTCDFNDDGRCNLIDLSIMLFYYGKEGKEIERYDLNVNSIIDFPDVSVLMYYWTG